MTLKKSKQPVQLLDGIESLDDIAPGNVPEQPPDVYRAKWTTAKREAYLKEHPENFAGPDGSYPIEDASDVEDAARLAGHASDPEAVKRKIIEIAKRLGLSNALPDSWKENMKDKEERSLPAADINFYVPIERIDKESREVVGTATAEVKDAHGTVIGYEASKDAFARWRGNIREMHDPKKAVGRALEWTPDEANKRIVVRLRISKGAEDTWQKLLDGTLTGLSIGGRNGKWTNRVIGGETVPYLERYDQTELSLVDNPSCPSSNDLAIIRADGTASDVLALDDEEPGEETPAAEADDIERAGARLSSDTRKSMHSARDAAITAAKSMMQNCDCEECNGMVARMDASDDDRVVIADIVRQAIADALRAQLSSTTSRVNALLARDASRSEGPDITRRVDTIDEQLKDIKAIVERIANQPVEGGPVLHGANKTLATQGNTQQRGPQITPETLEYLRSQGVLNNLDSQVAAASLMLQPMR